MFVILPLNHWLTQCSFELLFYGCGLSSMHRNNSNAIGVYSGNIYPEIDQISTNNNLKILI